MLNCLPGNSGNEMHAILCTGDKTWKQPLGLDNQAIHTGSSAGTGEFLSSPKCPDRPSGPSSLLSSKYQGLFPSGGGIKWLRHKTDHSLPSSSVVKNECISAFTPIYIYMCRNSLQVKTCRSKQMCP